MVPDGSVLPYSSSLTAAMSDSWLGSEDLEWHGTVEGSVCGHSRGAGGAVGGILLHGPPLLKN